MIRNCDLEEISDGRLYTDNDMVKADTGDCVGCKAACCQGMGGSIILDPYDIHRLSEHLGQTFEELLVSKIEIGQVDGVMLPNIKMGTSDACSFLDEESRCTVHSVRPGICRLFPLGRYWEDDTHFKYILQKNECKKDNLTKIKVKKWLATENLTEYNDYVVQWHSYLKKIQRAVAICMAGEDKDIAATQVKTICLYTLKTFYMTPYAQKEFFKEFESRIHTATAALGID